MSFFPTEEEFTAERDKRSVYKLIGGDDGIGVTSPFELYSKISDSKYSFLLESGNGPEQICRYSFFGYDPYLLFKSYGNCITLTRIDLSGNEKSETIHADPIIVLRGLLNDIKVPAQANLPPFCGGAVGLFSYDLVHLFETLPRTVVDDLQLADMSLVFVDTVVVVDHVDPAGSMIVCTPANWEHINMRDIYLHAVGQIEKVEKSLAVDPIRKSTKVTKNISIEPGMSQANYESMVKRCKEYIAAGDIFQANLSQRFKITNLDPLEAYETLRDINISPFSSYLDFDDVKVASSSPERLVRLTGKKVETRPIAGTRPRGGEENEDDRLAEELVSHPKERAEHVMLVDLGRNDIGRVCEFGSVIVDELMVLEKYSHVIHIVSNVIGQIKDGFDGLDLLKAVFPGGSITGVPKVRCMEIIDELEPVARGAYTGSIGYLSATGDIDLNIIIRTFVFKGGNGYVQVGAGIVADSDPAREYGETVQKGKALLETVAKIRSRQV